MSIPQNDVVPSYQHHRKLNINGRCLTGPSRYRFPLSSGLTQSSVISAALSTRYNIRVHTSNVPESTQMVKHFLQIVKYLDLVVGLYQRISGIDKGDDQSSTPSHCSQLKLLHLPPSTSLTP